MRNVAFLAAAGAAVLAVSASLSPAHSADRPGFARFAGGSGGFSSGPRFAPPSARPAPPRFGGFSIGGRCQGRRCGVGQPPGKPSGPGGSITLACPGGMHRVPGRGCVKDGVACRKGTHLSRGRCVPDRDEVVDVRPCPKGTHRHGRRCIPNRDDGPVVVSDPGKLCGGRRVRRGSKCMLVGPTVPPKVVDTNDTATPVKDKPSRGLPPRKPASVAAREASPVPPQVQALVGLPHRPRELVVLLATDGADGVVTDLMRLHGIVAEERHVIALVGGTMVRFRVVDNRPLQQVLAAVAADPRVLISQPNFSFVTSDSVGNLAARLQYAPQKIRVPEAHRMARGRGIRLAILDTGIDSRHPEIAGSIADSFDALNEGTSQAEAHGTAITGIITARKSLQGIAPDAGVLSVRAFASDGSGAAKSTSMALVKGIDWAFANKARLFNLSFAGPDDALLGRVIAEAIAKGAVFVAASGNAGPDAEPAYPAAYRGVIAVTATDDSDGIFAMAQRGTHVSVAAPGVDILAPAPGGGYDVSSGTSLATAHVTGIIALMLEEEPALSQVDIRAILEKTAHRHAADVPAGTSGAGRVDAAAAANAAASLRVVHPQTQAAAK